VVLAGFRAVGFVPAELGLAAHASAGRDRHRTPWAGWRRSVRRQLEQGRGYPGHPQHDRDGRRAYISFKPDPADHDGDFLGEGKRAFCQAHMDQFVALAAPFAEPRVR
jgi:hypothetical protein